MTLCLNIQYLKRLTKTVLNYFCLFRNNDAGFVLSELSGIGKLVLLTKGEINYDL